MADTIERGFPNYRPITKNQEEFHASSAKHKLLIGGYGSGKTYPTYHEGYLHAFQNPNHQSLFARNTWNDLDDQMVEDMLRIAKEANIIDRWIPSKYDLYLINGHHIMFRSLGMDRKNFKGMNLCQFVLDDPDVNKFQDVISFLYTRLRNPPHIRADKFQSIITSNWEGRNWLWKNYMRDPQTGGLKAPGGDGTDLVEIPSPKPGKPNNTKWVQSNKAYWMCPTSDNKMLPKGYIDDLALNHSPEWMDRYVYCVDVKRHSGLIYYDFDPMKHHMDKEEILNLKNLVHILAIDVGGSHPTAVMHMCTDSKAVYVYDEWYSKGEHLSVLGEYLQKMKATGIYRRFIIDPTSAKTESTGRNNTGSSIKRELTLKWRLSFSNGDNAVEVGIRKIQDALNPAKGDPYFFMDTARCVNLRREMGIYRRKEPRLMDMDAMEYDEKPLKQYDDCLDATRYGFQFFSKYIRREHMDVGFKKLKARNLQKKYNNLPFYRENPKYRRNKILENTYRNQGFSEKKIKQLLTQAKNIL